MVAMSTRMKSWRKHPKKERPQCRKRIEQLGTEGFTLEDIASGWKGPHSFSESLRMQARKMLWEGK